MTTEPSPAGDSDISRLIEVTYSSTADPAQFFELVQIWHRYMDSIDNIDHDGPHLTHFNKALDILGVMGRRNRVRSREDEMLGAFAAPAFLCDRKLVIHRCNTAADRLLKQRGPQVLDNDGLRQAIRHLNPLHPTDIIPLIDEAGRMQDCAVISLRDHATEGTTEGERGTCLIVLTRPTESGSATWAQVTERFALSSAESSVLYALLSGQTPEDIADARDVSLNTVRSQIRKLLDKTATGSLSDMIRQTILISTQIETVSLAARLVGKAAPEEDSGQHSILTSDGRLLSYRDMGDPEGRPVLFLHNMTGGINLPRAVQRSARANGWRLIAPSRAGFGASDPVPLHQMALVERTVRDCRELLDHLGVASVLVIGLVSSAGIAIAFGATYPQRTVAILNAGHAGVCDDLMIEAMPNPTRVLAQTMRKSSVATRYLVRVGIAAMDMLGPKEMLSRMVAQSTPEQSLLDDEVMVRLVQHAIAQGGDAFMKDGFVALSDFRPQIRQLPADLPARALLGGNDSIYPPDHARRLLRDCPAYEVTLLPDVGQYLFYVIPDIVFAQAMDLWQRGISRLTATTMDHGRDTALPDHHK